MVYLTDVSNNTATVYWQFPTRASYSVDLSEVEMLVVKSIIRVNYSDKYRYILWK